MIDSILSLENKVSRLRKRTTGVLKPLARLLKLIVREFTLISMPLLLRLSRSKRSLSCRSEDINNPRIIVSLASFPTRINYLWMVVELMFRQSIKPDLIVIYLAKDQFESMESLPYSLRRYIGLGLEIKFTDKDLVSHKKYHYAMGEYPNDFVVTIDDDIYYCNNILSSLLETYKQHPNSIIANRVREIRFIDNELQPYNRWKTITEGGGYNHLQTGVGGVLYPPYNRGLLYKDLLNEELALSLTPAGDDLWLYAMARLGGCKVIRSSYTASTLSIRIKKNISLYKVNRHKRFNDTQIENIRAHYTKELGIDPFAYINPEK